MTNYNKNNSEGYPDPTAFEALTNIKTERRIQGKRNKVTGEFFERMIDRTCQYYRDQDIADIEKTPEPMKPLKSMGAGKFLAVFTGQAQTDYKGIINGGRCIAFEAKHTDDDRIEYKRLTDKQIDMLERYEHMGASCFILVSFELERFYRIPWPVWRDMKATYGRKYIKETELADHRVKQTGGILHFLINKKANENADRCIICGEIIPEGRQVCPNCEKEATNK